MNQGFSSFTRRMKVKEDGLRLEARFLHAPCSQQVRPLQREGLACAVN
jgi:hypothetical protein